MAESRKPLTIKRSRQAKQDTSVPAPAVTRSLLHDDSLSVVPPRVSTGLKTARARQQQIQQDVILYLPISNDDAGVVPNPKSKRSLFSNVTSSSSNVSVPIRTTKQSPQPGRGRHEFIVNTSIPDLIVNTSIPDLTRTERTHIRCWHCTYNFDTPPMFIANTLITHPSGDTTLNAYSVFGCFCSDSCALAYNLSLKDNRVEPRRVLTIHMFAEMLNVSIIDYNPEPAPRKEILVDYGGAVTIEQFRLGANVMNKEYIAHVPPLVHSQIEVQSMSIPPKLKKPDVNRRVIVEKSR